MSVKRCGICQCILRSRQQWLDHACSWVCAEPAPNLEPPLLQHLPGQRPSTPWWSCPWSTDEASFAKQQPLEFAKMLADALWQALEADPSLDADEDWEFVKEATITMLEVAAG